MATDLRSGPYRFFFNQIGRLISQSSLQLIESWNAFFNG